MRIIMKTERKKELWKFLLRWSRLYMIISAVL